MIIRIMLILLGTSILQGLPAAGQEATARHSCIDLSFDEKVLFSFTDRYIVESGAQVVVYPSGAEYLIARWELSATEDRVSQSFAAVASRVIARLRDGQAIEDWIHRLYRNLDLTPGSLAYEPLTDEGRYVLTLTAEETIRRGRTLLNLIASGGLTETLIYVEPDYIYVTAATDPPTPNDTVFHTGQTSQFELIKALEAWYKAGVTGSQRVRVAVIDTGIAYRHLDLADNIWINRLELFGKPDKDDDLNGYVDDLYGWDAVSKTNDPQDVGWHGTACAGLIGAVGNNDHGIAGISWDVSLIPIRAFNASGCAIESVLVEAIDYALAAGAHIISASWAYTGEAKALKEEIEKADEAGVLFVAAAGNEGWDLDKSPWYPAAYDLDNILSVSATVNEPEELSGNYGCRTVDLAAPGAGIWSLSPASSGPVPMMPGTSFSTALVAGAAALVKSQYPSLEASGLKDRVLGSVDQLKRLEGKVCSSGRLNVYRAVTKRQPSQPKLCKSDSMIACPASTPY